MVRLFRMILLLATILLCAPVAPAAAQPRGEARPLVAEAMGTLSPQLLGTPVQGPAYVAAHDALEEAVVAATEAEASLGRITRRTAELSQLLDGAVQAHDDAAGRARVAHHELVDAQRVITDVAVGAFIVGDPMADLDATLSFDVTQAALRRSVLAEVVEQHHSSDLERARRRARAAGATLAAAEGRLEELRAERSTADARGVEASRLRDHWVAAVQRQQEVLPSAARSTVVAELGLRTVVLDAYVRAAEHPSAACGIAWHVLAGIGRVESRHGEFGTSRPDDRGQVLPGIVGIALDGTNDTMEIRDTDRGAYDGDPVYDRAVGPMQFIPSTWTRHAVDGDGNGAADPNNLYDAAAGAAVYLCRVMPADGDLRRTILSYNRSQAYVDAVLGHARTYASLPIPAAGGTGAAATLVGDS